MFSVPDKAVYTQVIVSDGSCQGYEKMEGSRGGLSAVDQPPSLGDWQYGQASTAQQWQPGHAPELHQQPIFLLCTEHYYCSPGWGGSEWAASLPSMLTCHSPSQGHSCPSSTFSWSPQHWSSQARIMDFSQHRRMTSSFSRTIKATFL